MLVFMNLNVASKITLYSYDGYWYYCAKEDIETWDISEAT